MFIVAKSRQLTFVYKFLNQQKKIAFQTKTEVQDLFAMSSFTKRNLVAIVMIPSIVLLHIGWNKLQYVEDLVPENQRSDENPVFAVSA